MTRFQVLALSLFALTAGCERGAIFTGEGLAPDLAVGETATAHLYELSQGFETQQWSCDGDDDGVEVDDPSIVLVTKLGVEKVPGPGPEVYGMKYALTGLKLGRVAVTTNCNHTVSSFRLYVR